MRQHSFSFHRKYRLVKTLPTLSLYLLDISHTVWNLSPQMRAGGGWRTATVPQTSSHDKETGMSTDQQGELSSWRASPWVQLVFGVICMAMIANMQYGW